MQAAANLALLEVLRKHKVKPPYKWPVCVPVDMRRRLLSNPDSLRVALFACMSEVEFEAKEPFSTEDQRTLWDEARRSRGDVLAEISSKRYLVRNRQMRPVSFLTRLNMVLTKKSTAHVSSLVPSSLGRFAVPYSEPKKLESTGVAFVMVAEWCYPALATYASTIDEKLSVTHTSYPAAVSKETAEEFCEAFRKIMERFIE